MISTTPEAEIGILEKKIEILKGRMSFERKEDEPQPDPKPQNWTLVLPPEGAEVQNYSPEQFLEFQSAVQDANSNVDRMLDSALDLYLKRETNEVISQQGHFFEYSILYKVKTGYQTFALPNFLGSPLLGKIVHFDWASRGEDESGRVYDRGYYHPDTSTLGFALLHSDKKGIVAEYFLERFLIDKCVNETIRRSIERYNHGED